MIEQLLQGDIVTIEKNMSTSKLEWNQHSTCNGVYLKHLVTSNETDGKFSCHLVKVQAGCEIAEHTHPNNWELHEVVDGEGTGFLIENAISYKLGTTIVIPAGQKHKVIAGDKNLYLLAKFIPALI
jgi:quercetin dioxygenase-like cupin family protein